MTEPLHKEPPHPEQANRGCKPLLKHIPKVCLQNPAAAAGKRIVQERFHTSLLQPRSPALTHVKRLEFFIIKKNPKPKKPQRFSIIYFRHLFWKAFERLLPASPHQRRARSPRGVLGLPSSQDRAPIKSNALQIWFPLLSSSGMTDPSTRIGKAPESSVS